MRRLVLTLVLSVTFALPLFAQPIPLSVLGLGPIYAVKSFELDGRQGKEFLVRTVNPLSSLWVAVYPQDPRGLCTSEPFLVQASDLIEDFNGDGIDEIWRFDIASQTITPIQFPACQR